MRDLSSHLKMITGLIGKMNQALRVFRDELDGVVEDLDHLENQDQVVMLVLLRLQQEQVVLDWEDPTTFAYLEALRMECTAVLAMSEVIKAWGAA